MILVEVNIKTQSWNIHSSTKFLYGVFQGHIKTEKKLWLYQNVCPPHYNNKNKKKETYKERINWHAIFLLFMNMYPENITHSDVN